MRSVVEKHSVRRTSHVIRVRTVMYLLSTAVPLLALTGVAMADDVAPLPGRTVQDLHEHDATRSRWGSSASETLPAKRHQYLCDIFHTPWHSSQARRPPSPCRGLWRLQGTEWS